MTLCTTGATSLDHLLGQRDFKPGAGDVVEQPTSRKLYAHEYEVSANLGLTDLERVAVIGQGGFGRVELVGILLGYVLDRHARSCQYWGIVLRFN